jgi:hypothetical protein
MLGAIVVAVLAVFGALGLQQTKDTEAGSIFGISGCNGSIVISGNTCDFVITFFDDNGTTAVSAAAAGQVLTSVSTTCTAATINGNGTAAITLFDAGTAVTANPGPGCDADANSQLYTWTVRLTASCPTTSLQINVGVTAPATVGVAGGTGSLSPGLPLGGPGGTPGIMVTCNPTNLAGFNGSTITIRKVD